jgi:acyl-CoA reductase-like NAD-dependent aldehyde dehydrogenase
VQTSSRIAGDEIFGPVLSVLTFRTPAEAIAKANNTPYGLSAGIWSDKGSKILAVADKLRAGVIWANTFNRFDPTSPFGGYKESGYGREGGRHGLAAYLDDALPALHARSGPVATQPRIDTGKPKATAKPAKGASK